MPAPADQPQATTATGPAILQLADDLTLTLELAASEELDRYRDIRVACATPAIRTGDVTANEKEILTLIRQADGAGADVLLFSDLALTGRTAGDLFFQRTLQDACLESLARITQATADSHLLVLLSLPLRLEQFLFKATAILYHGEIVGVTPASYLSREERRWFSDPLTPGILEDRFSCELITGAERDEEGVLAVQLPTVECPTILRHAIDEPLPQTPGAEASDPAGLELSLCDFTAQKLQSFSFQFVNLCTVIPCLAVRPCLLPQEARGCERVRLFNFDPTHAAEALAQGSIPVAAIADGRLEWAGDYRRLRRELIRRSLHDHSIVLYAGSGDGESTSQGIHAGHRLILSDGRVLAESEPYTCGLTLADLSAEDLFQVRSREGTRWDIRKEIDKTGRADRPDPQPFLMRSELDATALFEESLAIQGRALAGRLDRLGARPVIGLSGGLDSAVAFLACLEAARYLNRPASDVLAVFMPGAGTLDASGRLAAELACAAGADYRVIPIERSVELHLEAIGYRGGRRDVTFENAQARERTQILMDLSNLEQGLVVGTGDLSELALGWCTYNGDQMSMYAVNASLAKTVIRDMTATASTLIEKGLSPLFRDSEAAARAACALREILARPVSPELLPRPGSDVFAQLTEEVVGPYELIDFFLWHLVFDGQRPSAVYDLACRAFGGHHDPEAIRAWLQRFIRRFFASQFKRTASPEGVSVFPRRLVPLTAWHMPGDASAGLWLEELNGLPKENSAASEDTFSE